MVRTRDAQTTRVCAAKAPRKVISFDRSGSSGSSSPSAKSSSKERYSGGNNYNPQPTPDWQKGIGSFFKALDKPGEASCSKEEPSETSPTQREDSSVFPKTEVVSDDGDN